MFHLFVYGTLMQGQSANSIINVGEVDGEVVAERVGFCAVTGLQMYNLGAFPGVKRVENPQDRNSVVYGEYWQVRRDLMPTLDAYEGAPRLYQRAPDPCLIVASEWGPDDVRALRLGCYVYQHEATPESLVEEGAWNPTPEMRTFMEANPPEQVLRPGNAITRRRRHIDSLLRGLGG